MTALVHPVKNEVSVRALDLSDQDSVRRFAAAWDQPLHILVNNAGIMALPQLERTREGWEMQFATNFLGHFALTAGLHDALAAAHGARIVSVSSSANLLSPVVFDDLHFDFRPYDPPSPPTASPRPPTRCSLSRPRAAGPAKGSTPTPSTPAPSPPACNSTPGA
jgi:NAD(P)-dependent dehydrogenase (short-subunit alcohol dehydrogenase family)